MVDSYCDLQLMDYSDVPYEEDVCRKPDNLDNWTRYVEHLRGRSVPQTYIWFIYERAVLSLPTSFKIWKEYLDDRSSSLQSATTQAILKENLVKEVAYTNSAFERALSFLSFCPRLYLDYCIFLVSQRNISKAVSVLDRALTCLPILQHHRIWQLYIRIADQLMESCPLTAFLLWKRYLKLDPSTNNYRQFVDVCVKTENFDDAAFTLEKLAFEVDKDKSEEYLHRLCNLVNECPPDEMPGFPIEEFLRKAMDLFPKQRGMLWSTLGTFYVRIGDLDHAEQVFEEALDKVIGARDFAQVFETFGKLEETVLSMAFEQFESEGKNDPEQMEFIQKSMKEFQDLIEKRPFQLIESRLRLYPNNQDLWIQKIELYREKRPQDLEDVFKEALAKKTQFTKIFLLYAEFIQRNGKDHKIFLEETAEGSIKMEPEFWIGWSRLEDTDEEAIKVLKRATEFLKDYKLWVYFIDYLEAAILRGKTELVPQLEEAYEEMIRLKIATPDIIINYASFEQEVTPPTKQFEKLYRIYHFGIDSFGWPAAFEFWNLLLPRAIHQWGPVGKLERLRELFEEALKNAGSDYAAKICVLYAESEEKYGLAKNAIALYQRAAMEVESSGKLEYFKLALSKAKALQGLYACRQIFEAALTPAAGVSDEQARQFVLDFCGLEVALGEYDRARTLFAYGAQLADPERFVDYWEKWREFEKNYGSEDTFREMLRVKRAVQNKFSQNPLFVKATEALP